ncbi:ImmA/IrrE family metallo-endopeptidase [Bacteroides sp.]|uniref:ImmA/IrrE family metallo-endopeptidase n=1 Tax=Bacteroides sp. TaxID=29523 RepID=UPI0040269FB8
MTNREIEQVANEVLTKYLKKGVSHKILNEIMATEAIKYKEIKSANDDFVGVLTKGNNEQAYIMVNGSISNDGCKHFTIAHELGHHFLQHQLTQNSFYCSHNEIVEGGVWQNPIEQEANYFAACLLMPEEKVKSAFICILQNSRKAKIKDYLHVKNDYTFSIWCGMRDSLMKR